MLHTLRNQHFNFFYQKGFLELEDLLTEEESALLRQEISRVLALRNGVKEDEVEKLSPALRIKKGRDLWRDSPFLSSLIHKKTLGSFASALTKKFPLRFAFDQWVGNGFFSSEPATLERMSSIQGLACGLLFNLGSPLNDPSQPPSEEKKGYLFPSLPRNGSYLHPTHPIDYRSHEKGSFYLLVYSQAKAMYAPNPKDPCNNQLKQLGYTSGDSLKDCDHPIVFC